MGHLSGFRSLRAAAVNFAGGIRSAALFPANGHGHGGWLTPAKISKPVDVAAGADNRRDFKGFVHSPSPPSPPRPSPPTVNDS